MPERHDDGRGTRMGFPPSPDWTRSNGGAGRGVMWSRLVPTKVGREEREARWWLPACHDGRERAATATSLLGSDKNW